VRITRQNHIQHLQNKKQERIKNLESSTKTKTKEIILSIVPKKEKDGLVSFDFAYSQGFL